MRKIIGTVIALVVLVALYWGWALMGAAELASVASTGDPAAVMQRVDLPALTRSLGAQIAHAYLDQNPQFKKLLSVEQGFLGSAGAGEAEALLREMLTPEAIAALLKEGRAGLAGAGAPDGLSLWRMPPLSEAFRAGLVETLRNSSFDGPMSFVVGLTSPEGRFGVHLHLTGTTWRLSGLDIPEEISARLAREIAVKVGGSAERGGGQSP